MTEPLSIPLSPTLVVRFAERVTMLSNLSAEAEKIQTAQNEAMTTVIAGHVDPDLFREILSGGWTFAIQTDAIVCTPPAPLALMPDEAVSA